MTTDRWHRIRDLFLQAIEVPEPERAAFLDAACAGDEDLRRELDSLLSCDAPEEKLLDLPLPSVSEPPAGETGDEWPGRRIGPYRVFRLIGRGGMGSVYLGGRDDQHYRKQVAIKLLKRGMDTDFMLSRFRQERQILASLEHPYIARLLDGGATSDGLPYFVMEYVDGVPVTQFCFEKNLPIPERLWIFCMICEAVQYAHQNLVVHRDIKPGNILSTQQGVPKLLDFGIAKVIDYDAASGGTLTQPGFRMLTPDYASPEHVKGEPITTASDIYSLGAVLYEILSGVRPHRFPSISPIDLERAICAADPEKPSVAAGQNPALPANVRKQFRRQISGDLDKIILTAMARDPRSRYASAAELSADLVRHLEGLPVTARDKRLTYRAAKFARRHWTGIAALLLLIASLAGGTIATTVQARRAERRFQLVRGLANTMLFELQDEMAKLPGSTALQAYTTRTVVTYLDRLAEDGSADDNLGLEMALAYERAGILAGHPFRSNLGDATSALSHFRKALAIYERLAARSSVRPAAIRGLIDANLYAGGMETLLGNPAAGARYHAKASAIAEEVFARGDATIPHATQINVYFRLADAEYQRGAADRELAHYRSALEIASGWLNSGGGASAISYFEDACHNVGSAQARTGDLHGARASFQRALAAAQELLRRTDVKQEQRFSVLTVHNSLGDVLAAPDDPNLDDRQGALEHYRTALRLADEFARVDVRNVNARRNLAACYRRLGMMAVQDNAAQGLEYYRKALSLAEDLSAGDPANIEYLYAVSRGCMGVGEALSTLRRYPDAIANLSRAVAIQNRIAAASPGRVWNLRILSRCYALLGAAHLGRGDPERALRALYEGLAAADRLIERAPASLYHQLDRADVLEALGSYYVSQARRSKQSPDRRARLLVEARSCFGDSLSIWRSWITRRLAVPYATRRETRAAALIAAAGR